MLHILLFEWFDPFPRPQGQEKGWPDGPLFSCHSLPASGFFRGWQGFLVRGLFPFK
jgi:hypothetical protein